jgi:hypothetical protein
MKKPKSWSGSCGECLFSFPRVKREVFLLRPNWFDCAPGQKMIWNELAGGLRDYILRANGI